MTELQCDSYTSYILNDNEAFSLSGFKSLQSQAENGFLRCVRASYNGRIQLIYLSKSDNMSLVSFRSMLNKLSPEAFLAVCRNVISVVSRATDIGYLHTEYIVTDTDHIYINPKTYAAHFIYLPLLASYSEMPIDNSEFETEFRQKLIQLIDSQAHFNVASVRKLRSALTDIGMSLGRIAKLCGSDAPKQAAYQTSGRFLSLDSVDPNTPFHHVFQHRTTVIGRADRNSTADVTIPHSPFISNPHCEIIFENGYYYVKDNSTNGTYINNHRVMKLSKTLLHDGDTLRLASTSLRVTIK